MEQNARYYDNLQVVRDYDHTLPFYYAAAKNLHCALDEPRWHEEMEIKYILSGTAEIICGTEVFLATQGDIVIINSCEPHGVHPYGDTPLSYHLLMIPTDLSFLQTEPDTVMPRFEHLIQGDTELAEIIERLFTEVTEQPVAYRLCACGALALLFAGLHRRHAVSKTALPPEHQRMVERLQPALNYILRHYPEEIAIDMLAEQCTMSVYHFCRIFKFVTGSTAIAYINQLRVNKAASLLKSSEMTIAEIAATVGMTDECYFSRCFKKWIGISPSVYRKEHRK